MITFLALCTASQLFATEGKTLTGKVIIPTNGYTDLRTMNGIPGVTIKLASTGRETITDANGDWILIEANSVKPRGNAIRSTNRGHLRYVNDRLRFDYDGLSVSGKRLNIQLTEEDQNCQASRINASSNAPDTLLYYLNGRVVLRDTVSSNTEHYIRGIDSTWNADPSIAYGYLYDERDSILYRTIKIGNHEWLAQNLAHIIPGKKQECLAYNTYQTGRYYTWARAMNIDTIYNHLPLDTIPKSTKGICPEGWALPSVSDWDTLIINAKSMALKIGETQHFTTLMAGYYAFWEGAHILHDAFGFRAIAGGYFYNQNAIYNTFYVGEITESARWWSYDSSYNIGSYSYATAIMSNTSGGAKSPFKKSNLIPIRCMKHR